MTEKFEMKQILFEPRVCLQVGVATLCLIQPGKVTGWVWSLQLRRCEVNPGVSWVSELGGGSLIFHNVVKCAFSVSVMDL